MPSEQVEPSMSAPTIDLKNGRGLLVEMFSRLERGAEIGVWEGGFSEKICRANPRLQLICVDPWAPQKGYLEVKNDSARMDAAYASAQQRLQPYDCTFLRMTSLEAAAKVPDNSLDWIYIDANHLREHVLADLDAWIPKVKSAGIIAGHDYFENPSKPFIQVKAAIDQYTHEHHIENWFVLASEKSPSWYWVKA